MISSSRNVAEFLAGTQTLDSACTQGDTKACASLGSALIGSELLQFPTPRNLPRALVLLTKACDAQEEFACSSLGGMYADGDTARGGPSRDIRKATAIWRADCASERRSARFSCGSLHDINFGGRRVEGLPSVSSQNDFTLALWAADRICNAAWLAEDERKNYCEDGQDLRAEIAERDQRERDRQAAAERQRQASAQAVLARQAAALAAEQRRNAVRPTPKTRSAASPPPTRGARLPVGRKYLCEGEWQQNNASWITGGAWSEWVTRSNGADRSTFRLIVLSSEAIRIRGAEGLANGDHAIRYVNGKYSIPSLIRTASGASYATLSYPGLQFFWLGEGTSLLGGKIPQRFIANCD